MPPYDAFKPQPAPTPEPTPEKPKTSLGEHFAIATLALTIWATVGGFIAALMIPAYILHGWVITKIWGWFVVTNFGIPQISIGTAIGLEMLFLMLRPISMPDIEDKKGFAYKLGKALSKVYLGPLVILLIAYIAKIYA